MGLRSGISGDGIILKSSFSVWEETFLPLGMIHLTGKGFDRNGSPANSSNLVYVELFNDALRNNYIMQPIDGAEIRYSFAEEFDPSFFRLTPKPRNKKDSRPYMEIGVLVNNRDYTFKIYSESED